MSPSEGSRQTTGDGGTDDVVVPDRQCGRCRRAFAGDPALMFQTDWALCPECSSVLMPRPAPAPQPS